MKPYSAEDEVEGLLRMIRMDHNIPPTTPFKRLINVPRSRCRPRQHRCCLSAECEGGENLWLSLQ